MKRQELIDCLSKLYEQVDGVWTKPEVSSFAYSDGDEAEERIAAAIRESEDVSLFSRVLREHQNDWPSRYHLSASRANLLRPVETLLKGSVLEIGAGCGAITRYLGEIGAEVVALEGSRRRAAIARSRCRDLENVHVVNDVAEGGKVLPPFDVVTLIGVLEYARIYGCGAAPERELLKMAWSQLAEDGVLILAIENQLGLKYLAGMPEDHVGRAMHGIAGHYSDDSVVTFGSEELRRLLIDAGFTKIEFALPFPDYKFPKSVLMAPAFDGSVPAFNAHTLASQSAVSDPQIPYPPLFPLERVWETAGRNGLLLPLANSFLVIAHKSAKAKSLSGTGIAFHYATDRLPAYSKQTAFHLLDDGGIEVRSRPVCPNSSQLRERPIGYTLHDDAYVSGAPYTAELYKRVTQAGWRVEDVTEWLLGWLNALDARIVAVGGSAGQSVVPGWAIDALPQNLIVPRDGGAPVFIDMEWEWLGEVGRDYLVYRAVVASLTSITAVAAPQDLRHVYVEALLRDVMTRLGFGAARADIERYLDLDGALRRLVYGADSGLSISAFAEMKMRLLMDVREAADGWSSSLQAAGATIEQLRLSVEHEQDLRRKIVEAHALEIEAVRDEEARERAGLVERHRDLTLKLESEFAHAVAMAEEACQRETAELEHSYQRDKSRLMDEQNNLQARVNQLQEMLGQKDVAQGMLEVHVSELEKERSGMQALAERLSVGIATMEDANAEQASEIQMLRARADDLASEVARLSAIESRLGHQLADVLTSKSWRLTRPFRACRRLLDPQQTRGVFGLLLKRMYDSLPVSQTTRLAIKDKVFKAAGSHLESTHAYRAWRQQVAPPAEPLPESVNHGSPAMPAGSIVAPSSLLRYVKAVASQGLAARAQEFVSLAEEPLDSSRVGARVIAYYLPQFHPIPENDAWWGRGFTEWTNVSKAMPQFIGHYQPHLPGELGFYDLRLVDVMRRQAELAKLYGIEGFCFHYYWFGGRRLLERPLEQLLASDIDLPFCICWANENWTRRWDGMDNEVLVEQDYGPEDDFAFIQSLEPYLRDRRYIRVDGKPLIILYRPSLLPDAAATLVRWRDYCRRTGIGEIFLGMVQFDKLDPREYGFDTAIEFPPHKVAAGLPCINDKLEVINPDYAGYVVDYDDVVDRSISEPAPEYPLAKGIFPSWDNEARKPGRGYTVANATPAKYHAWLKSAIDFAHAHPVANERLVFVNAWNEWAEGAHLEPDRRYGYAYLEATKQALLLPQAPAPAPKRICVIVHAFYPDLVPEMLDYLERWSVPHRLIFTTTREAYSELVDIVASHGMEAEILVNENHGRDILPFLEAIPLVGEDEIILKLHTKRSLHRGDGEFWRRDLLNKLMSAERVSDIFDAYVQRADLGLVAPDGHILPMSTYWGANAENVRSLSRRMGSGGLDPDTMLFAAGSMFFIRPQALAGIRALGLRAADFEAETGQVDGTLAHAIERCFSISTWTGGYFLASSERPRVVAFRAAKHYNYAEPTY